MIRFLDTTVHAAFDWCANLVSKRWFWVNFIALTLAFMATQFFVANPWDDPKAGFLRVGITYSVLALWIEGAMKVHQADQLKIQALADEKQQETISRLEAMARRATAKDAETYQLMEIVVATCNRILDAVEDKKEVGPDVST